MSLCGMGSYPAQKTMDAARRFSTAYCRKAMELVLETDYKMKTSFDDQDRLLELLIVQLGQEASVG
jgi:DNA polymerase III delta subunit